MRYNHFMNAKYWILRSFLLVVCLLSLNAAFPPQRALSAPPAAATAADLMAAVQALRAKQGLPPLIVDSALMFAAQKHSEYQASIGTYSHIGAGGTRAKDRAIAAGFGAGATVWMSENVAMAQSGTSLDVVLYQYWGDPDHWNTMTNPRYIYGGAGVAVSGGVAYYTLDTGYTTGGASSGLQATSAAPTLGTPLPTLPRIYPVLTSTKSANDGIVHVVQDGQTLIGIAQAYKIQLADLKKLNNLASDIIFTGQKLIIQPSNTPGPTATITRTPTPTTTVTVTAQPTRTATLVADTPTPTATLTATPALLVPAFSALDRQTIGLAIVGVCAVGLVLVLLIQFRKK